MSGVAAWLLIILPEAQVYLAEGEPDYNLVIAATAAMIGLFLARDADKTSEDQ